MKQTVSIIIPTYNEQENIENCILSLSGQTLKPKEIIIVDDGSTDDTLQILKSLKDLKVLTQTHKGPGTARNLGASKASGEILVFVDADMTFHKNFLNKLIAPIVNKKTIGTFSKDEQVANLDNFWASSWSLVRGFQPGKMHPEDSPDKQPVFRAILKTEFTKVNGFDENRGYDDDWSLSEKLGVLAINAPGAVFYHSNPASVKEFFTQAKWLSKRKYKFGLVGQIINLVKYSIPVSTLMGLKLSYKQKNFKLVFSQLIFDLARSAGLLEHVFLKRAAR